ncbi:MAG TPA: opioid growth factor receptor-related protein [Verrucomicrobiae bacterium]|nr:opioid growth factor receptor-related protein [Verrucomicrobiae bacterium]
MNTDTDIILESFRGTGTDHRSRTLTQIVQKSDPWLEEMHDYIQCLFPLCVEIQFNPNAPLLTDETRAAFTDPGNPDRVVLQQNCGSAIYRMLVFYGYSFGPGSTDVSATGEWRDRADKWLTDGNRNFMWTTWMLCSMVLLGRQELTRSFHECVTAGTGVDPTVISRRTLAIWEEAEPTVPSC